MVDPPSLVIWTAGKEKQAHRMHTPLMVQVTDKQKLEWCPLALYRLLLPSYSLGLSVLLFFQGLKLYVIISLLYLNCFFSGIGLFPLGLPSLSTIHFCPFNSRDS